MSDQRNAITDPVEAALLYLFTRNPGAGSTRIQKLLFLAELDHVRRYGQAMTGAEFISYHYGPWSPQVVAAWERLQESEIIEEEVVPTRDGHACHLKRPAVGSAEVELPTPQSQQVLDRVLDRFACQKTKDITSFAKQTPAYLAAGFGEPIDLSHAAPPPFSHASDIDWETFLVNSITPVD